MKKQDVRWRQRFDNYVRAVQTLTRMAELADDGELSEAEQLALIKSFEFTHELSWNLLKDYLQEKGNVGIMGSKDATRKAFEFGLIEDGDTWMQMIEDRNLTSHTYDEPLAERIATDVLTRYFPEFVGLLNKFTTISQAEAE